MGQILLASLSSKVAAALVGTSMVAVPVSVTAYEYTNNLSFEEAAALDDQESRPVGEVSTSSERVPGKKGKGLTKPVAIEPEPMPAPVYTPEPVYTAPPAPEPMPMPEPVAAAPAPAPVAAAPAAKGGIGIFPILAGVVGAGLIALAVTDNDDDDSASS